MAAHLFVVADPAGDEPARDEYDDDLELVPVRLVLAFLGRCSCDGCCRAWLAGDQDAGIVDVTPRAPRLRVVGR